MKRPRIQSIASRLARVCSLFVVGGACQLAWAEDPTSAAPPSDGSTDTTTSAAVSSPTSDASATPALHDATKPKLQVDVSPYIWLTSFSGHETLNGFTLDIDKTFVEILDESDTVFGLMGAVDLVYDRLVFQFNGAWTTATFSKSDSPDGLVTLDADLRLNSAWLELFGGYRIIDSPIGAEADTRGRLTVDAFVGGRFTVIDSEFTLSSNGSFTLPDGSVIDPAHSRCFDTSEQWVEPFIGLRLGLQLPQGWAFSVRGDIGGFGAGSDLAWQAIAVVGYRWYLDGWSLGVFGGYRALGQDYSDGGFGWDVITHGPLLGMQFQF